MLQKLFNSTTRVQVLSFFFQHPARKSYLQEVVDEAHTDPANTSRELQRLERMGLLKREQKGSRRLYSINTHAPSYRGLAELFGTHAAVAFLPVLGRLSGDRLSLIENKEWYHQRFDGSPLFLFTVGEAELRQEERKPAGTEADVRVCFFGDGKADWYLDEADIRRGARIVMQRAKKTPNLSKKLLDAWRHDEEAFQDYFDAEFPTLDFARMSDDELAHAWRRYYQLVTARFTSSAIIDHFALGTDRVIREKLRVEVYGTVKGGKLKESEFNQIFAVATAPVHQSFINLAEIELLNIALGRSRENVEHFAARYFWLHNNYYEARQLTEKYFQREILSWKKVEKPLEKELQSIEETPKRNAARKRALLRRFRFSRELRTLLTISEDFTYWQDERKKATYLSIHVGCTILNEVAKRTHYTLNQLKYCVGSEVETVLTGGIPTRRELAARSITSVFVATRDGYFVETGAGVKKVQDLMFGQRQLDVVQDVRGLSACVGRAVGTVKVVQSVTEIGKVQKGDVLIAVMTRPDYVPAMRKAAAIVTNEGGITSHAAIVSRELGIPCIIGTKIATQIFKDGDLVEVNANHGWIRKVQA